MSHATKHHHPCVMKIDTNMIWCFECDAEVCLRMRWPAVSQPVSDGGPQVFEAVQPIEQQQALRLIRCGFLPPPPDVLTSPGTAPFGCSTATAVPSVQPPPVPPLPSLSSPPSAAPVASPISTISTAESTPSPSSAIPAAASLPPAPASAVPTPSTSSTAPCKSVADHLATVSSGRMAYSSPESSAQPEEKQPRSPSAMSIVSAAPSAIPSAGHAREPASVHQPAAPLVLNLPASALPPKAKSLKKGALRHSFARKLLCEGEPFDGACHLAVQARRHGICALRGG